MNQILIGDALEKLKELPDELVQCCVTSPPYWGLRDYQVEGQLGLEKTPEEYIEKLVTIFEEVRRVLRKDGALWLNLGDSYISGRGRYSSNKQTISGHSRGEPMNGQRPDQRGHQYLKDKDLAMIPARVAIALQQVGWWLRSDIIWSKPSCMPESVTDRPTKSHEYIFLLTKSAKYYYDADAIKEPYAESTVPRQLRGIADGNKWQNGAGGQKPHSLDQPRPNIREIYSGIAIKDYASGGAQDPSETKRRVLESLIKNGGSNKRDVWTINTNSFRGAHFATFPPEIPELCIKAGSKKGDMVLDPFAGSGTTLEVAKRLGRQYIGIELNPKYVEELIEPRLENISPLFANTE